MYNGTYKYSGTSPQKTRLVALLVKGMNAVDALTLLEFENRAGSKHVYKVLKQVYSNAVDKGADKDKLVILDVQIGTAPTRKKSKVASRARIRQILNRSSHIKLELIENK